MTMVVLWWKFFGEETMAFSLQKRLSVVPLKKYKEQFKCILSLSLRQSSSSMPCMSCNVCCISGSILSHHEWTCQCQPLDTNFVTSSKMDAVGQNLQVEVVKLNGQFLSYHNFWKSVSWRNAITFCWKNFLIHFEINVACLAPSNSKQGHGLLASRWQQTCRIEHEFCHNRGTKSAIKKCTKMCTETKGNTILSFGHDGPIKFSWIDQRHLNASSKLAST